MPKMPISYTCSTCNFTCSKNSNYQKHLLTRKHKMITNDNEKMPKQYKCDCGKEYKHSSGLSRHIAFCKIRKSTKADGILQETSIDTDHTGFITLIQTMLCQMAEKDKQMADLIPKIGSQTNSNNTFNIQMFLNHDCKNAINMTDFIRTIHVEITDMLNIGNNGYVEGISDIFIRALNKLEITQRPIHCTDAKRETVYVKEENKWGKGDATMPILHGAIKHIDRQNLALLPKWMEENPDSRDLDTPENIQLTKMFANSLGKGDDQSILDKKILKRVLPAVNIHKGRMIGKID